MSAIRKLCLIGILLPSVAFASKASVELTGEGRIELEKKHYGEALKKFNEASRADPMDAQAVFFQAVALNRMGRFDFALILLRQFEKKGGGHPDLDFETGWALMGSGHDREAISRLEKYEASRPGRGQTQEFLGRSYFRTGRYGKARSAFAEALKRDPGLEPTVELYLAALERKLGHREAAIGEIRKILAEAPQSEVGRALREIGGIKPVSPPPKPFSMSASFTAGYNDNVIGLGNTIPLPTDISRKGAIFTRLQFGIQGRKAAGENTLAGGYALLADNYDGLSVANLVDHFLYGDFAHPVDPGTSFGLRGNIERTDIGGKGYRNSWGLRPSIVRRFTSDSATEFAWSYASSRFLAPAAFPAWNRNGNANTFSLNHYLTKPNYMAILGYSHTLNNASGSDFSFREDTLSAGARSPIGNGFAAEAAYSHNFDRYDNPNSLSGVGRRDDTDNFQLRISRPVASLHADFFAQFAAVRNHSNITFYSFNQNVTSAGLSANF